MAEEVKVFRTWSSRFALRIVWALKIKGVEHENIFEVLTNKSPLLLKYNPIYKKVPVLVHNGIVLSESLVILEYVEETWKQSPLFPEDPYERAKARFWAKFGDEKLLPSVSNAFISQGKEQEEAVGPAIDNLKLIEEELKGKKFFGGETIGYLDIVLGWLANLINVLEEVADIKLIDTEKFPFLSEWIENFSDVPVIKESWPPRDKLIVKYQIARETTLAAAAAAAAPK